MSKFSSFHKDKRYNLFVLEFAIAKIYKKGNIA
jgi:hypothetical protein